LLNNQKEKVANIIRKNTLYTKRDATNTDASVDLTSNNKNMFERGDTMMSGKETERSIMDENLNF
jgi:hypothetical protein